MKRGRYTYHIEAKWPNEEASFIAVIEVPYEFNYKRTFMISRKKKLARQL